MRNLRSGRSSGCSQSPMSDWILLHTTSRDWSGRHGSLQSSRSSRVDIMDPALLRPVQQQRSRSPGEATTIPSHSAPSLADHTTEHYSDEEEDDDLSQDAHGGADGVKRPRLRLAHACDRCRKRKIRCDTHQPCGPCQLAKNICTFHIPSRRVIKPKSSADLPAPPTSSGFKRAHSPPRNGLAGLAGQGNLEARLAALEAMLGDVPPQVHNAFLSSLDARLGSGTGVGLKEGKGEGVGVAPEALSGSNSGLNAMLGDFGIEAGSSWGASLTSDPITAAAQTWRHSSRANGKSDGRSQGGVSEMTKMMETVNFFYEDEIGQAKWQGTSSDHLLASFD